jgi:xanthine/CO dehydrogenase XdhC/CoxF family maturation factor
LSVAADLVHLGAQTFDSPLQRYELRHPVEAVVLEGALCGSAQDVLVEPVLPAPDDHSRVIRWILSAEHEQ